MMVLYCTAVRCTTIVLRCTAVHVQYIIISSYSSFIIIIILLTFIPINQPHFAITTHQTPVLCKRECSQGFMGITDPEHRFTISFNIHTNNLIPPTVCFAKQGQFNNLFLFLENIPSIHFIWISTRRYIHLYAHHLTPHILLQ